MSVLQLLSCSTDMIDPSDRLRLRDGPWHSVGAVGDCQWCQTAVSCNSQVSTRTTAHRLTAADWWWMAAEADSYPAGRLESISPNIENLPYYCHSKVACSVDKVDCWPCNQYLANVNQSVGFFLPEADPCHLDFCQPQLRLPRSPSSTSSDGSKKNLGSSWQCLAIEVETFAVADVAFILNFSCYTWSLCHSLRPPYMDGADCVLCENTLLCCVMFLLSTLKKKKATNQESWRTIVDTAIKL